MEEFVLFVRQEWYYDMRRDMQEIVPGLFLGPYSSANKCQLSNLLNHGITHIICIRQMTDSSFIKINFPEHFRYLELIIADTPVQNIICYFRQVKEYIDECLQNGGKVLVHGNPGISRRDAYNHVQCRRFCITPNPGFIQQLREYEVIYKARLTSGSMDQTELRDGGSAKRKREDDEIPYSDVENTDSNIQS